MAELAVEQPGDVIAGANMYIVWVHFIVELRGDRIGFGYFFRLQAVAFEHIVEIGVAAEVKLVRALQLYAAIAEQPNAYYYLYHKARILAKMGDKAGALATARQSIELAAKDKENLAAKAEYTRLNEALIAGLQ